MKWMWKFGVAAAILFGALPIQAQDVPPRSSPVVTEIQITSTRTNLGGGWRARTIKPVSTEPDKTFLEIFKNHDGAYDLGGTVVDASLIAALVNALRAPVNAEPTRDDLGFTPEWLKSNASSLAQSFAASTFIGGKPIHESSFESAFTDPAAVDKAITALFRPIRCVDCNRYTQNVDISVEFDDHTRIVARTSTEFPYMLPWHLQSDGKNVVAYNADISRALAALMPENSANRSRLAGEHLANQLGNIVLMQEEHQTQLREVESQTGGTLSAIRAKYEVESAYIGDANPEAPAKAASSDLVLRLKAADQPANFGDNVALAYVDGTVAGTNQFMSDGQKFEKLALSVPWLTQFAQNHPRTPIEIAFVHQSSLSDEGLSAFSADMRAIGRENVVARVAAQKTEIAFVSVGAGLGRSDWLVLPNRHMLLWRFWRLPLRTSVTASELPAWSDSDYSTKPCVGSKNNFLHCVGREVSPEGNLLPLEQSIQ